MTTIGILGAGISGLSTAFHLSRRLASRSDVKIVLLEKSKRLGGWIKSEDTIVYADGKAYPVVLEAGPRTLKPKSLDLLELIHLLGLRSDLKLISHSHEAARNRYIYFPETGLTRIPDNVLSLVRSQFTDRASLGGLLPSAVAEVFRAANKPPGTNDESFDAFMSRRFGPDFARRFGSSLVHGVYAADSRELSIRAAFGPVWDAEIDGGGSVVRGVILGSTKRNKRVADDFKLGKLPQMMDGVSVYKFRSGMETIPRALGVALQADPRVEIRISEDVRAVRCSSDNASLIVDASSTSFKFSRIISTLPLPAIAKVLPVNRTLPHLLHNPSASVHVINLVFPPCSKPLHPPGFGYLVPRPAVDYRSSNDPFLGCLYDTTVSSAYAPTVLTVMLGGPFSLPSKRWPIDAILTTLAAQLGLESLPEPLLYRYHIQSNCIPTPLVGHLDRMAHLQSVLQRSWDGRLQIIGAGVGGVSVGDCVRDGRAAAINVADSIHNN